MPTRPFDDDPGALVRREGRSVRLTLKLAVEEFANCLMQCCSRGLG